MWHEATGLCILIISAEGLGILYILVVWQSSRNNVCTKAPMILCKMQFYILKA